MKNAVCLPLEFRGFLSKNKSNRHMQSNQQEHLSFKKPYWYCFSLQLVICSLSVNHGLFNAYIAELELFKIMPDAFIILLNEKKNGCII